VDIAVQAVLHWSGGISIMCLHGRAMLVYTYFLDSRCPYSVLLSIDTHECPVSALMLCALWLCCH